MQLENPANRFAAPVDFGCAHRMLKRLRPGSVQTDIREETLEDALQFEKFPVLAVRAVEDGGQASYFLGQISASSRMDFVADFEQAEFGEIAHIGRNAFEQPRQQTAAHVR